MKAFLRHACDRTCVVRSIKVALVVGTVLALINHYDAIFAGALTSRGVFQILLTYLVPFGVSAYGSAMQARHLELQGSDASERGQEL